MKSTYIPKKDYKMVEKEHDDTKVIDILSCKKLYTIMEVVKNCQWSYETVRKDIDSGTLKSVKRAHSNYVTHDEFVKYLKGD
jgi:hypothetical protein|tara:strand:+ start:678 stop:923 length:246 start_codon:yes stop_codon:yes gene_type:complete